MGESGAGRAATVYRFGGSGARQFSCFEVIEVIEVLEVLEVLKVLEGKAVAP